MRRCPSLSAAPHVLKKSTNGLQTVYHHIRYQFECDWRANVWSATCGLVAWTWKLNRQSNSKLGSLLNLCDPAQVAHTEEDVLSIDLKTPELR